MHDLMTKDNYLVDDGFCLLDTGNSIVLANITFPDKEYTIEEYEEWEDEFVATAIPVSIPKDQPFSFRKYRIKKAQNIGRIAEEEFKKFDNLEEEDVAVPFIGGLSKDYFRELLTRLWNTKGEHIQDYSSTVRNHYQKVFKRNGGELDN